MNERSEASPIEILLVEDDPGDALITREALEHSKVLNNLQCLANGEEAIAYLRRTGEYTDATRPDLILLDLNLPRVDGREVLAEIKADPDLRRIPVVVLTTSAAEEDILRSYDLHANAYVTKPVDFDRFVEVVRKVDDFFFTVVRLPTNRQGPMTSGASGGGPHPPPPGVSIRRTSPGFRWTVHLSGRRLASALEAAGQHPVLPDRAVGRRRRGPGGAARAALGDEAERCSPRAPRGRARCPRRRGSGRRRRSPRAGGSDGRAAGTTARAPRSGVFLLLVIAVWTPLMPGGAAGRPRRRRSSRSTPSPRPPMRTLFIVPWPRAPTRSGSGLGQGAEAHVGDALAHLDVAGPHRGRRPRADERAAGADDVHRSQRAAVGRDGRVDGGAQREGDRRHGDGRDGVDVAARLRIRAGEVEGDLVAGDA